MSTLQSVLEVPLISRLRRNHGLEHATLHVLAQRFPRQPMAGYSDPGGFWIVGSVSTEALRSSVDEALARLQAGEAGLAVHPNCGTNFVTSGVLAGGAAALVMFNAGRRLRDKLERLPLAASLATLALIAAQPLGLLLQARVTTSGFPGALQVAQIIPPRPGGAPVHRVLTRG